MPSTHSTSSIPGLDEVLSSIFKDVKPTMMPLPIQASARRYYRLQTKDRSIIVMHVPLGLPAHPAGDLNPGPKSPEAIIRDFCDVQKLLHELGLRVPTVFASAPDMHFAVLEDLGDLSLERALYDASPLKRNEYFRKATEILVNLRTLHPSSNRTHIAFSRAFTSDLIFWELEHFRTWGIEFHLGALDESATNALTAEFHALTHEVVSLPTCLVHRDVQSRNLMLYKDGLYLIDFQDALLGPDAYDLVSLLCDSYVTLNKTERSMLLDYFCEQARLAGDAKEEFQRGFYLVSLQRKLKDAGRFIYLAKARHQPEFLPFFKPTLAYIREVLEYFQHFPCIKRYVETLSAR